MQSFVPPHHMASLPLKMPVPTKSGSGMGKKSLSCSALFDLASIPQLSVTIDGQIPSVVMTNAPLSNIAQCLASSPPLFDNTSGKNTPNRETVQDLLACIMSPPDPSRRISLPSLRSLTIDDSGNKDGINTSTNSPRRLSRSIQLGDNEQDDDI